MPIHEYLCSECGTISEILIFSASDTVRCSQCGGQDMKKLLSASSSASGLKSQGKVAGLRDTGCCGSSPETQGCTPGSCCGKAAG